MKIVYCITDCSNSGGMERIICIKANYLVEVMGYDVTIITADKKTNSLFYKFSDKIKFINLDVNYFELEVFSFPVRQVKQIKKRQIHKKRLSQVLISEYADIVISTYTHEFTILPQIKDGSKKIAEIHFSENHNRIQNQNRSGIEEYVSLLTHDVFKRRYIKYYDKFVVLTQADKRNWEKISVSNLVQIYNILPFYPEKSSQLENKRILSVGRYVDQKGYDLLIEAWALVAHKHADWHLDIFGSGEEHDNLVALIKERKLENSLTLHSPTHDIEKEYLDSSIYVLSSRYEGFGMVLVEAMACGLPCISFDCPQGPSEIIADRIDGLLAENGNIQDLADKLELLINDKDLRIGMGNKARQNIRRFAPDEIMKEWDNLFQSLLNDNK